eukprot:1090397-Ditylum_brightwellii.AAC.1
MPSALEYDGIVGVTQCPIKPEGGFFMYNFVVDKEPGTYWYHSHSGSLKDNLHDALKGPLIVHTRGKKSTHLVDHLTGQLAANDSDKRITFQGTTLAYGQERILFFSDGFKTLKDQDMLWYNMGGLNPPSSKNEDGFGVGTNQWELGTCNGKVHEVIHVEAGNTY